MADSTVRQLIQLATALLALTAIFYSLRIRKMSALKIAIVVWLFHVVLFYAFVLVHNFGYIPSPLYATIITPWAPAVRLHGVLAATTTLYIIEKFCQHG